MSTTTIITDVNTVLDGITAATAASAAIEALAEAIKAEAHTQAIRDGLAEAEADEATKVEKGAIIAHHAVVVTKTLSGRKLAEGVGQSPQTVTYYIRTGAVLALPGKVAAVDIKSAVIATIKTHKVPASVVDGVIKDAKTRGEVMKALRDLCKAKAEATTPEGPEGGEGDTPEAPEAPKAPTPWQDRLAALVAQSLVEGATPDEVRAVVATALA